MAKPDTPLFTTPAANGQLSNNLGSNLTTDAIPLSVHYETPADGNDPLAAIRIQAQLVAQQGGDPLTPVLLWDSGWTGIPPVQSIPTISTETGDPISGVWNGRVYLMFAGGADTNLGSGNVWSAPLVAGGVGTWRQENGLGPTGNWFTTVAVVNYIAGANQLCAVNNWLYCCINSSAGIGAEANQPAIILGAPIGGDGRLGDWIYLSAAPYNLRSEAMMVIGRPANLYAPTSGNLYLMGGWLNSNAATNACWSSYLNYDGTIIQATTAWFQQQNLPATLRNATIYYDNNFPYIYLFGGDAGGSAVSTVYNASVNTSDVITWATNGTSLLAAKTRHAMAVVLDNTYTTRFYIMGGGAAWNSSTHATTVYTNTLTAPATFAGAWSAVTAVALPSTPAGITSHGLPLLCAFTGSTPGLTLIANELTPPGATPQGAAILADRGLTRVGDAGGIGPTGQNTATLARPWIDYMYVNSATYSISPLAATPSWITGNAPGLTAAALGTATITNNSDGSQDVAFLYRGWGGIAALSGDAAYDGGVQTENEWEVQISAQCVSDAGGVSPYGYSTFKVGQPPSIVNLSTNQPTYEAVVISGTPTVYWELDETSGSAIDSSGNDFTGTIGTGVTQGQPGTLADGSPAYNFTSTSTGVTNTSAGVIAPFQNHNFSVEAWVNPTTVPGSAMYAVSCGLTSTVTTDSWLYLGVNSSVWTFGFHGDDCVAGAGFDAVANTWYHVVGTYNAATNAQILYLNGVQIATRTATGDLNVPTGSSFHVGYTPFISGTEPSWQGLVQQVSSENYILTAQQVAQRYSAGRQLVGAGIASLSFDYLAGSGGESEESYEIQVLQGATLIFDSGPLLDLNNGSNLTIAPLLQPSTSYNVSVTAVSNDSPMAGSTNQATDSAVITTGPFITPAAPTSLAVAPNVLGGALTASWTASAGASYYRVYYRLTGQTWYIYQDQISASPVVMMDHIALNTLYDVAVSAVDAYSDESAFSNIVSGVQIATPTLSARGSANGTTYSAFLHVAGAGATYSLPISFFTLDMTSPGYVDTLDATAIMGFGQAAPVMRYGTANYHSLTPKALLDDLTPVSLRMLQAIIDQCRSGATAFWRDALGGMLVVNFANQSFWTSNAQATGATMVFWPPSYREMWLYMIEVLDQIGPYVAAGSAQGYLTLVDGRVPPLDTIMRVF